MAKALVIYDSKTGNTEKMAVAIGEGLRESDLDVGVTMAWDGNCGSPIRRLRSSFT